MKKQPTKVRQRRSQPFDSSYQPSKREMEQEVDMPGASMKTLQKAFFSRPTKKK